MLLSTQYGSQVTLNVLSQFLPGKLTIQSMEGNLTSEMKFNHIEYSTKEFHLSMQSLHVSWSPFYLFKKQIVINHLESSNVKINVNSTNQQPATNQFALNDSLALLKHLTIHHLSIKNLILLKTNKITYIINEISLTKKLSAPYILIFKSSFGNLNGQLQLNWSPIFSWDIFLNANELTPSAILNIENSQFDCVLTSKGTWDQHNKKIKIKIDELKGKLHGFPLQGHVEIDFNNGTLQVQNSHLRLAEATAKISGSMNQQWNFKWEVMIPKLEQIIPDSHGMILATGDLLGTQENLQTNAYIKASNISIANFKIQDLQGNALAKLTKDKNASLRFLAKHIEINTHPIQQLNIKILSKLVNDKLLSQLLIELSPANQIQGQLNLSTSTNEMMGKMWVNFHKLNEILIGIPEIKNADGILNGTINFFGTLFKPQYSFDLLLKQGQVFIPKLGTRLNSILLQANYLPQHPITLKGSFIAGKGIGKLDAIIDVNQMEFPITLKLEGENLQFLNLREYKINISPKLNLAYKNDKIEVDGKILIPFAEIQPTDFSSVVTLPAEAVIEDQKKPETSTPKNINMNLQIALGDHIQLVYENLTTALNGNVRIQQTSGSQPIATGVLNIIKGKYRAYGHSLKIKEGRLIYNGNPLADPGLDIRAFKHIKTLALDGKSQYISSDQLSSVYTGSNILQVGVWVKGTLNHPSVTLYSEPAGMNQQDILSYLVFGYPQSQISSASAIALLNSFGGGAAEGSKGLAGKVTDKVQNFLGLSELNIGSTEYLNLEDNSTGSTTTVNIGKKINKKLSLHYSVGFFHPIQILSLKYIINKYLTLQSETSSIESGADLFYEIEKD